MSELRSKVAVIFGGMSSEHSISILSAGSVLKAIDRSRYEVIPIGITRDGAWVRQPDDPARMRIVGGDLPEVADDGDSALLSMDPRRKGFWFQSASGKRTWQAIDVVFPVLHGPYGEDGTIQGMLELAGVPFVGCGVFAASACMDKGHTKTILAAAGLPVGTWYPAHDRRWREDQDGVANAAAGLGWPLFVKPARAGSSMGVSKVNTHEQLAAATEEALTHDPRVLYEASVENAREIECGLLQRAHGAIEASVCAEIKVREGNDFFGFAGKYLDDSADRIIPAQISDIQLKRIQSVAVEAFEALGCEGLARVDVFLTATDEIVINEVNTMPGFTSISNYPRMWSHSGLSYESLIDELLAQAMNRGVGLR